MKAAEQMLRETYYEFLIDQFYKDRAYMNEAIDWHCCTYGVPDDEYEDVAQVFEIEHTVGFEARSQHSRSVDEWAYRESRAIHYDHLQDVGRRLGWAILQDPKNI